MLLRDIAPQLLRRLPPAYHRSLLFNAVLLAVTAGLFGLTYVLPQEPGPFLPASVVLILLGALLTFLLGVVVNGIMLVISLVKRWALAVLLHFLLALGWGLGLYWVTGIFDHLPGKIGG